MLRLAVVLLAVLATQATAATRPPIALTGTATIGAVDFGTCTSADAADATVLECDGRGAYRGKLRGTATYTWHWHLVHGAGFPQTAHGREDGIAVLRLGTRGTVRLTMRGAKQIGYSTGRWTFTSGTKAFARRRGSGTYRFETVEGANGFRSARLVLRGTLR